MKIQDKKDENKELYFVRSNCITDEEVLAFMVELEKITSGVKNE